MYKFSIYAASFFILTLLCVLLFNAVSIVHYSHEDETRSADCAIVAGAGIAGDLPSAVFRERLNHAITLYQQGLVRKLILTGGLSPNATRSDAAVAQQYVLAKGIPASAVLIEEQSTLTRENVRFAKMLMQEHQLHSALIVSDPLHMRRLMTIVQDNGITAWTSPTPTSRYRSLTAKSTFLLSETIWYSGYLILRILPLPFI